MGQEDGVEIRDTSLRVVFSYKGKQRREALRVDNSALKPNPANIKYAKRIAAEIRESIRIGTFDYAQYFPHSKHAIKPDEKATLLHAVMDEWLMLAEMKASTRRQYTTRLKSFWKVHLDNVPIEQVRHADILKALKEGTWSSVKSRNNELSLINNVFEFAIRNKYITENPCNGIERQKHQRPPPDPFNQEDVRQILEHLSAHRPEQIANLVQFMFFTGLRTSEVLALRWRNVDYQRREILVDVANVYDDESDSTKTSVARLVKLTSRALEALDRQKAHTYLQGEHVFHDPKTGQLWAYSKLTDVRSFWADTLKKLGIRYRRPYNTRHTYATLGLMSGAKPGFLAKQLGHSLQMFFTVYAKWMDSAGDELEMSKLELAIQQTNPNLTHKFP